MYVHWNYYLALEEDMAQIARFIEPAEDNLPTYSIELAHLFLTTCSEVDVVLKLLCELLDAGQQPESIDGYRAIVSNRCPQLIEETCAIPRYDIIMSPWAEWANERTPSWWSEHQGVKHRRSQNFADANLGNALAALSALHITTVYYYHASFNGGNLDEPMYKTTSVLKPKPRLFKLSRNYYHQLVAARPPEG